MFICCASWLGVCRQPSCCMCTCIYQSMTLRSLIPSVLVYQSPRRPGRTKFPAHKKPSVIVKVDISNPCSTNDFHIQGGQRGSQSTASGGEPSVQSPPNRAREMRPGGSARQLSRPTTSHCNLPRDLIHQITFFALFQHLKPSVAAATQLGLSLSLMCFLFPYLVHLGGKQGLTLNMQQLPDGTGLTG